jgi:uncharacterized membrane protein YcjF (UPF0283 family)
MVRYWHKADIATVLSDVRFWMASLSTAARAVVVPEVKASTSKNRLPVEYQRDLVKEMNAALTVDDSTRSSGRGVRWAMLFWCASGSLLLLAMGVAVSDLITDLLTRNRGLGWLGLAFAILAMVSLLVIAVRETTGLTRLATVEKIRQRAAEMIVSENRMEGPCSWRG